MNTVEIWLCIAGLTLVTLLTRGAFLLLGERVTLGPNVQRALRYAPAAVLIAIVVPDLLLAPNGNMALDIHNHKLIAATVASVYFWFTRQMVWMIVVGMAVFTILRLYF